MRFLDYCKAHKLDPFDAASRDAHAEYQKAYHRERARDRYARIRNPRGPWLKELRNLNTLAEELRRTANFWTREIETLQIKGTPFASDSPEQIKRRQAEKAADDAQRKLDEHGAQHPELYAEFIVHLELRDYRHEVESMTRQLFACRRTAMSTPPAVPTPPAYLTQLEMTAAAAREEKRAKEREAMALQEQYENDLQLSNAERRALGETLYALGQKVDKLAKQFDQADIAHRRALDHFERRSAIARQDLEAHRSATLQIPLIEKQIAEYKAHIAMLEAQLPNPHRAPLRATYAARKAKPAATQRPVISGAEDLV